MKLESTEAREALRARIREDIRGEVDRERQAGLDEIEKELADELVDADLDTGDPDEGAEIETGATLSPDEVMTKRADGTPICFYRDDVWYLIDKHGQQVSQYFGVNSPHRACLDFTDETAAPLYQLQKLLAYSVWPGKNPTERPYAANTVKSHIQGFNVFLEFLYRGGYLRSTDPEIPPDDVALITADTLKAEIERLLDERVHYSNIRTFAKSIKFWCKLGRKPYCPVWLRPTFTFKEVFTSKLAHQVGKLHANEKVQWEAIDFDNLEPMLITAKNYIDIFSTDLFWLEDRFAEAHALHVAAKKKTVFARIEDCAPTKELFNRVLAHPFVKNPESGVPWFEVSTYSTQEKENWSASYKLRRKPIYEEVDALIGAASFLLLIFTGMRREEALSLTVHALKINGKSLDLTDDVLAQVEAGSENSFDLTRSIYKTDPYGACHETPIPKIAAKAFAVLCKLFRHARELGKTDFLFPSGGVVRPGNKPKGSGTIQKQSLYDYLKRFCRAAGVDYQHPHKCRKSLATLIINHDSKSLEVIRFLLGHQSVAMTMEYIMALPGINEELLSYYYASEFDKITEWLFDALDGHVAGPRGDHTLEAIQENLVQWQGNMLPFTMKTIIKSMQDNGLAIHRTPVAWCIWFDIRVPADTPCMTLEAREAVAKGNPLEPKDYFPNPEFCVPHECGYAGYSRSDLPNAKRALKYAKEQSAKSGKTARAHYDEQVTYWAGIVERLENGHPAFTSLGLLEKFYGGTA